MVSTYLVESFSYFVDVIAQFTTYLTTDTSIFGFPIGYVIIYFCMSSVAIRNFLNKGDADGKS